MDAAKRGADALGAGKYADAIKEYTAAIKVSPTSPDYHIKRSMAYQRTSPADYSNALSDAENAVIFAQQRAKRELIVQAQLRRAIGLFGLERYADARFVLDIVKRVDPKEKTLAIWENKIAAKTAALSEDDPKNHVTVKETPEISKPKPQPAPEPTAATESASARAGASFGDDSSSAAAAAAAVSAKPAPAAPVQTPANKIRHDWYQNNDSVTFTLLAKGVPKDKAAVDIQPRSLTISFPISNESDYDFSLDPLYAPIDVSSSTYNIMSTKIEIILKKVQPGQKWHALESSDPVTDSHAPSISTHPDKVLHAAPAQAGPVYPTSSRTGPKNWDKLANDMTTSKNKNKEKKNDADDDDDYDYDKAENGDDVNNFFQKLYAGADPDTRRAMMKSFSESNGTALSTNWSEVGKAKTEVTPPEGMEEKKW